MDPLPLDLSSPPVDVAATTTSTAPTVDLLFPYPSILEAQTAAWVVPTATVLDPLLNFLSFAMLARVVLSWYPEMEGSKNKPWWAALVVFPTEPLIRSARGFVPPAFGVDITPVFWLAIFTFIHEILLGQQGLLTMKIKYGI